jgi:replicative DNA helicase
LLRKALSAAARIPLHTFYDGKMTVEELYRLYPEAAHFQTDKWQFMSNPCLTHQQLKEKCASGEKPDMLIIDDFDLLNSENTFFNRITHLNELGLSLKKLSLELNIPILISTNVNEALETRPDKRPRPHDLPDKGLLYHYANMILFLFREEIYWKDTIDKGIAEIIITKNDKGVTDTLHLAFQQEFGSFHNLATI